MAKDYTPQFQKLLLELMMHDHGLFSRIQNIYNAENFHKSLRETADFIGEYAAEYSSLPSAQMVEAATGTELQPVQNYDASQEEWFLDEFEKFTRDEEIARAVYKADISGAFKPCEDGGGNGARGKTCYRDGHTWYTDGAHTGLV